MKKKDEITELLQHLYGMSDDQLLKEFKTVEAELEAEGAPLSQTRKGSSAYGQN